MEEWRDVKGYEGLYKVSSYGRVMSIVRSGKMLSMLNCSNGYHSVYLYKDKAYKMLLVHRLVATAFIPNPNNYPIVNHKDEVKTNNHVENLEWCTKGYNYLYNGACYRNNPQRKPVSQYTKDGKLVKTFRSLKAAADETGIWLSLIAYVAAGEKRHKTAGGYVWRYAE